MTVRAILKVKGQRVVTVRQDMMIEDVIGTLSREKIGAVVVSDDGAIVAGLLSERDIIKGLSEHGAKLLSLMARDLMTRSFTPAKMDMPILHVLDIMTQGRFRHMPVLENGRLAGLVSIGDAVKARLDILENEAMHLKEYIGGR
ncbi:MAG: putative signal transduction protein with domain [Rhodospirillales bacterium]|nr:putative signal transduction protein with domain [Rhodospirillales bacterium]